MGRLPLIRGGAQFQLETFHQQLTHRLVDGQLGRSGPSEHGALRLARRVPAGGLSERRVSR